MAGTHSKSGTAADKAAKRERQYVVGYRPHRGDRSTPQVNIAGKWLAEMGFEVGQKVTVKVEQGCLILTAGS
ncbi:SymE family type I addiction module toxin [Pantoea sp. A4]|uniref:SymE family type I addiction module toxin n=1 Tax=Pantoea sp. A4 TaxID=1225184 RepID=UPI0003692388|nr:SymE family type I addiction module toxin [Pantoea sp. A4]